MSYERRVRELVPGDVFAYQDTSVLVLVGPQTSVELSGSRRGDSLYRVRVRRMDTGNDIDIRFELGAVVQMVITAAENMIPTGGSSSERLPAQRGGSRPGDWPA